MTGKTERSFPADLLMIKRWTATTGKSPANNSPATWSVAQMGVTSQTGYTPVGTSYIYVGHSYLGLSFFNAESSANYSFALRNNTSTDLSSSVKPIIDIVYAKSDYVENGTDTTGKLFKVLEFTKDYTLANSTSLKISATDLDFYVPTGYQVFSIVRASSGTANVGLISFDPFESNCIIQLRNVSGSSVSTTAAIGVSFIRKDYAEQILA